MAAELDVLRERVPGIVSRQKGPKIADITDRLGVRTEMASLIVRPLVGDSLETTGTRKGTRYWLAGSAAAKQVTVGPAEERDLAPAAEGARPRPILRRSQPSPAGKPADLRESRAALSEQQPTEGDEE